MQRLSLLCKDNTFSTSEATASSVVWPGFNPYNLVIAAATIAWLELAWIVSSHFFQFILNKASASTLLLQDL